MYISELLNALLVISLLFRIFIFFIFLLFKVFRSCIGFIKVFVVEFMSFVFWERRETGQEFGPRS